MPIEAFSTGRSSAGLLPTSVENGLMSLLARGSGVILLGIAAAAWLALITWSATDPALVDNAGARSRNLLGPGGAFGSDLLMQSLGLSATILLFAPCFWGLELFSRERIERFRQRLLIWPLSALLFATALAALPVPSAWPLDHGFGGILGDMLFQLIRQPAAALDPRIASPIALVLLTASGFLALALSLDIDAKSLKHGLSRRELEVEIEPALADLEPAPRTAPAGPALAGTPAPLAPAPSAPVFERVDPRAEPPQRRTVLGLDLPEDGDPDDPLLADTDDEETDLIAPRDDESLRMARRFAPDQSSRSLEEALEHELSPPRPDPPPRVAPAEPAAESEPSRRRAAPELRLPSLNMLNRSHAGRSGSGLDQVVLRGNARLLEDALAEFGIAGRIAGTKPGPVVTLFELEPERTVKVSRVIALGDEIARAMGAGSVRVAALPGRSTIGIEIPNARPDEIGLRELLETDAFRRTAAQLPLAIGRASDGEPVVLDLARLAGLLVAGAPGSGKASGVSSMLLSLLFRLAPSELRLILIDPRMLEFAALSGLPHLLTPVISEASKAAAALDWAGKEVDERQKRMSMLNVRSIETYNNAIENARRQGLSLNRRVQTGFDRRTGEPLYESEALSAEPMPFIVIVIEEMAELMRAHGRELESALHRLSKGGRAAGIHIIAATQRPSADVVTDAVREHLPARICYRVSSRTDSRIVLGTAGAEQLLGSGDLLLAQGPGEAVRVHGPYVSEEEVEQVAADLARQLRPVFVPEVTANARPEPFTPPAAPGSLEDGIYERALALYMRDQRVSAGQLRRRLAIDLQRADELLARLRQDVR